MILSLLTLTLAELNSTKSMGPVLAIGVGVSLLAMMTLLPGACRRSPDAGCSGP